MPSDDSWQSVSKCWKPWERARSNECRVFSGAALLSPRCAMMTKRDGVAMTAGNRNTTSNSAVSGSRTPPSGAPDERKLLASDYVCTRRLDADGLPVVGHWIEVQVLFPYCLNGCIQFKTLRTSTYTIVHCPFIPPMEILAMRQLATAGFRGCQCKPDPTALLPHECDCASALSSRCNAGIQNSNCCLSIRCKLSPPVLFARYKANSVESLLNVRSSAQQQQDIRYWQHTACHKGVQHQQLLKKHTADNIHPA